MSVEAQSQNQAMQNANEGHNVGELWKHLLHGNKHILSILKLRWDYQSTWFVIPVD